MKAPELARVRKAATRHTRAADELGAAIAAAIAAGHSDAAIGRALGISRQAVQQRRLRDAASRVE